MGRLSRIISKKSRMRFFTTPSHGGKLCITHKFYQFYRNDISETDFHNPIEALNKAEKCAKKFDFHNVKFLSLLVSVSS